MTENPVSLGKLLHCLTVPYSKIVVLDGQTNHITPCPIQRPLSLGIKFLCIEALTFLQSFLFSTIDYLKSSIFTYNSSSSPQIKDNWIEHEGRYCQQKYKIVLTPILRLIFCTQVLRIIMKAHHSYISISSSMKANVNLPNNFTTFTIFPYHLCRHRLPAAEMEVQYQV